MKCTAKSPRIPEPTQRCVWSCLRKPLRLLRNPTSASFSRKSLSSFPQRTNLFPFTLSKIIQKSPKCVFVAEPVLLQEFKCICWHHQYNHPAPLDGTRVLNCISFPTSTLPDLFRWFPPPLFSHSFSSLQNNPSGISVFHCNILDISKHESG